MRHPFDEVGERLLGEGLAPRHVRRYLRELKNHLDDVFYDEREAGYDRKEALARAHVVLGDTDTLTEAMLAQKQKFLSVSARAPWAVFMLLPPLLVFGFFIAMGAALAFAGWLGVEGFYFDTSGKLLTPPDWYVSMGQGLAWFANFLLPPLVSFLIVFIALRQRMRESWPVVGVLLTALLGCGMTADANFPVSPAGHDWTIALIIINDFQEIAMRTLATLAPLMALYIGRHTAVA